MKCLIVQPIHEVGLALLRENGIEPVACPAPDMATVAQHIAGCDAVITRDAGLSGPAFAAADKLCVVVIHGTGHDPVDKTAAAARGVIGVGAGDGDPTKRPARTSRPPEGEGAGAHL